MGFVWYRVSVRFHSIGGLCICYIARELSHKRSGLFDHSRMELMQLVNVILSHARFLKLAECVLLGVLHKTTLLAGS